MSAIQRKHRAPRPQRCTRLAKSGRVASPSPKRAPVQKNQNRKARKNEAQGRTKAASTPGFLKPPQGPHGGAGLAAPRARVRGAPGHSSQARSSHCSQISCISHGNPASLGKRASSCASECTEITAENAGVCLSGTFVGRLLRPDL